MGIHHFNLFADYFQIYVSDAMSDGSESLDWDERAISNMVATMPGYIHMGTARNMTVPVTIEIRDSEPTEDSSQWDHITECGIEIPSGILIVGGLMDPFDSAARIKIEPVSYRVRIYYGGLETLSSDGLEGDDHYKVVLWPGRYSGVEVVKRHRPS